MPDTPATSDARAAGQPGIASDGNEPDLASLADA